ncbi:MAG: hypothetical protein K2X81_11940 [Candidatus Obscuribacterales bacterium]|nr:hypothetical protein [Candidatus Obscuribacterales bacterium]
MAFLFSLASSAAPGQAELSVVDADSILSKINHQQKLLDSEAESLISAVQAKPNDSNLHYLLGRYYESENMGTLAAQEYQQSFDLNHKFSKGLVAVSRIKLRLMDEVGAYAAINDAIKLFPNDYDVLVTAGLLLQRRGEAKKAEFCYAVAMQLGPPNAELLAAQAALFYSHNQFYEALQMSAKALKLDPTSLPALSIKGRCLQLAGNSQAAFLPLKLAYENSPSNSDLAQIYSDAALGSGNYESALAPSLVSMIYMVGKPDKLLRTKRRVAMIMRKLSPEVIRHQIDLAEAKLKTSKSGDLLYFCLGDVFDRLGDKADGIKCYERGLAADPNYSRGYLRLAEDLEDYSCDYEAALKNYKMANSLDSRDPEIQIRYNRLKSRLPLLKRDVAWQIKSFTKQIKREVDQADVKNMHVFSDSAGSAQKQAT